MVKLRGMVRLENYSIISSRDVIERILSSAVKCFGLEKEHYHSLVDVVDFVERIDGINGDDFHYKFVCHSKKILYPVLSFSVDKNDVATLLSLDESACIS